MVCTKCGEDKPITRFQKKGEKYSSQCKNCRNKYNREKWYPRNKEKQKQNSSKYKKENKYKIIARRFAVDEEKIKYLFEKHANICSICGIKLNNNVVIDHCHNTNIIRGILCRNCNTMIGRLGDTGDEIRTKYKQVLRYLENKEVYNEIYGG